MKRAVVLCLASCVLPLLAFAQSSTGSGSASTQPILVATVNIYDAKIVSQQNNLLSVSFDLSNRQNAQPGVRYAVELLDSKQNVVDEMVYPDVLNLSANSNMPMTAQYTAPSYLSGTYQLVILSSDTNGLPLAQATVGEVTLLGSGFAVQILPSSCALSVAGAKTKQTYTLDQGVDIAVAETLDLTCSVQNNSSSALTLTPTFQTYYRSAFGAAVQTPLPQPTQVTIGAGKTQTVTLPLPKASTPQSYDVQVSFTDASNVPSNNVLVHYVLDGASATIQNLTLDNTSYSAGQSAQATLFWTGPANNFPDARVAPMSLSGAKASIHMVDAGGNSCGQDVSASLNTMQPQQTIAFPISASCVSPVVTVTLTDAAGATLASSTFTFTAPAQPGLQLNDIWILLIALVILVLGGYIVLRMHKSGGHMQAVVLLVLAAGSTFALGAMPQQANADTYSQNVYVDSSGDWSGWYTVNFTVNLDNNTYAPGATITAYGSAQVGTCANSLSAGLQATINNQSEPVYAVSISGLNANEPVYSVDVSSNTFTAQTVPGTYNASFYEQLNTPQAGAGAGSYFCLPAGTNGSSSFNPSFTDPYSPLTIAHEEAVDSGQPQNSCISLTPDPSQTYYGCNGDEDNGNGVTAEQCSDASQGSYLNDPTCQNACGTTDVYGNPEYCTALCTQPTGSSVPGTTPPMTSFTASDPYNIPYTVACPSGETYDNGECTSGTSVVNTCPDGSQPINGQCPTTGTGTCSDGSLPVNGICPGNGLCADGSAPVNGVCPIGTPPGPGVCPDGSQPVNGICPNGLCADGSAPVNGVCPVGGGSGGGGLGCLHANSDGSCGVCNAGYILEGGQCIFSGCGVGYIQTTDASGNPECNFSSCPANYTQETDASGNPECVLNSCSIGYVCKDGDLYTQAADCSLTFYQACSYGCTSSSTGSGSCNPPPSPVIATWNVMPILLKSGQTTSINWLAQNVASCSVTGSNEDGTAQSNDTSSPGLWDTLTGTEVSSPILGQTVYTLNCLALQGAIPSSVSTSTTVNVVPTFEEN